MTRTVPEAAGGTVPERIPFGRRARTAREPAFREALRSATTTPEPSTAVGRAAAAFAARAEREQQ